MQSDDTIPYGFCHCGCGQKTTISSQNHAKFGWVKGEPMRFMKGHAPRIRGIPDYAIDIETGCWNWQKAKGPGMYGRFEMGGRRRLAHVEYWQRANGEQPPGTEIHHVCGNPRCVNPEHLRAVTRAEHIRLDHRSKLSIEKARAIRDSFAAGTPAREIAKFHEVSVSAVRHVLAGHNWCE